MGSQSKAPHAPDSASGRRASGPNQGRRRAAFSCSRNAGRGSCAGPHSTRQPAAAGTSSSLSVPHQAGPGVTTSFWSRGRSGGLAARGGSPGAPSSTAQTQAPSRRRVMDGSLHPKRGAPGGRPHAGGARRGGPVPGGPEGAVTGGPGGGVGAKGGVRPLGSTGDDFVGS